MPAIHGLDFEQIGEQYVDVIEGNSPNAEEELEDESPFINVYPKVYNRAASIANR